ncbi:hypothetical protein PKO51_11195 [Yokenella regensburgei]|uniref:hypothetical protein n=1 Tax=Yokenella regensburgei TaxID=158877 RepID=UPI0027D97876|nr:hypothetical protein [Yokenella regensburgei]MDQ4429928.1 hypothetical protein [Yokenella regensburgei]
MEVPDREVMAVVEAQQQITAPAAAGAVVVGAMVAVLAQVQVQEPVAAAQAPVVVALVAGVEAAVPVVDQEAVQVAEAGHLRPRIMCSAIPDKPSAALVVRWMA